MLSGKQISISVLVCMCVRREKRERRESEREALSGTAELSVLKSNKKSCKGSLRTTRNSLLRSSSLAKERGLDREKGSGCARAMEKETRINSR